MLDGQAALFAKRRNDAIQAYEAALNEKPNDFAAMAGLQQAKRLK
jgi:hypothetical protein